MRTNGFDTLEREERARGRAEQAESFWQAFRLTENGRVKSTLMLNSFCLSVVFLGIYAAAFIFLVEPLHAMTAGAPAAAVNLAEALIPALAGTAVCCLSWPLFKEKRTLPGAYLWLALLAAACLVTMLVMLRGDRGAAVLFLQFFLLLVPAPVLLGGGVSGFLYHRYSKQKRPAAPAESWKRQ